MPGLFRCAVSLLVAAVLWSPGAVARGADDPRPPAPATDSGGALKPADLMEIQRLLNSLDFHTGAADGIAGPRTRAAIREFQRSIGRASDGEATHRLLDRLREHAMRGAGEPAAGSAHLGAAIVAVPEAPRLERMIDTDFFGLQAVPKPWRMAGDGFTPDRRLGMRAGTEHGPVLRTLHDAWSGLSAALGLSEATPEAAVLYGPRRFAAPFELTVGFRMAERAGRLTIGPYRGDVRRSGFRCVFSPAEGHRIALVRVDSGGETVLAERSLAKRIRPGILHELKWWWRADGGMEIALGEFELFSILADDDTAFGGVAISARNGGYSISHVRLHATAASDTGLAASR